MTRTKLILLLLAGLALLMLSAAARADPPLIIATAAGNGVGDGGAPTAASLDRPASLAFDGDGNLHIADLYHCRVRKVSGGTIATVAGSGRCAYGGDGGPAKASALNRPAGVALDSAGDAYIADSFNCRVRKISGGTIATIAGTGVCGYGGDGGPATSAALNHPWGLAFDSAGDLYIGDSDNCRVRKITAATIATVAGNGTCGYGGDGGPAVDATLHRAASVALDATGNLYIADYFNCRVREVMLDGTIATVAGNGTCGYGGDGGPATAAALSDPTGVAIDAVGHVYIVDAGNCRVREITGGTIGTAAGNGVCAYAGDGGPPAAAALHRPAAVAFDVVGHLYIADAYNCRVREVIAGTISTVAGGPCGFGGDGGAPIDAELGYTSGVAFDPGSNLYIVDAGNCRVREVNGGVTATVAGSGICAFAGDGGASTASGLNPQGIALDGLGNLYIADSVACRVREVSGGIISTVAGNGVCSYSGDGGPAASAALSGPQAVTLDVAGNLYIADAYNCRVRKVIGSTIATIAGTGTCGDSGDGGPATSADLKFPGGIAVDGSDTLYISDSGNCRVRKVTSGVVTSVAGNGACGYGGDGGPAASAMLNAPGGVAVDSAGNLYIADSGNCRVRKVTGGVITTVAGGGACDYGGDGDLAATARLNYPVGVALDATGNLYIADAANHVVRKVSPGVDGDDNGIPDSSDNCPLTPNAAQTNTDREIDNGTGIAPSDTSVPNAIADTAGDACSTGPDTDHDGLPDVQDTEPLGASGICAAFAGASDAHANAAGGDITDADGNGPSWDTDGDGVRDGVECILGHNPRLKTDRPSMTECGGSTDADNDGLTAAAEYCKWGTSDTSTDSDGDGLKDCIEANDTNGDGVANFPGDTINSAKAANGVIQKTLDFDLNGDGFVNFPGDTILSAKMVFHVGGICT